MKKQINTPSWNTFTITHQHAVALSMKEIFDRLEAEGVPVRYLPLTKRIVPKFGFEIERNEDALKHTITWRWRELK